MTPLQDLQLENEFYPRLWIFVSTVYSHQRGLEFVFQTVAWIRAKQDTKNCEKVVIPAGGFSAHWNDLARAGWKPC
jgi:hypothetical protein